MNCPDENFRAFFQGFAYLLYYHLSAIGYFVQPLSSSAPEPNSLRCLSLLKRPTADTPAVVYRPLLFLHQIFQNKHIFSGEVKFRRIIHLRIEQSLVNSDGYLVCLARQLLDH